MRLSGIIAAMLLLALAAAGQSRVELAAGSAQVGRLGKIEFTIRVDGKHENPFDQDEVEIGVELTSRSGKRIVQPAFWYQNYDRKPLSRGGNNSEWMYPVGRAFWMARFAPAVSHWR